jgi:hypothetical protein
MFVSFSMTVPFLTLSQNAEFVFELAFALYAKRLTVCVTRAGAGGGTPSDWENAQA